MRKDILSFAKGKTPQQFCILPSAFCIQISVYRNDKLKFEINYLPKQKDFAKPIAFPPEIMYNKSKFTL